MVVVGTGDSVFVEAVDTVVVIVPGESQSLAKRASQGVVAMLEDNRNFSKSMLTSYL